MTNCFIVVDYVDYVNGFDLGAPASSDRAREHRIDANAFIFHLRLRGSPSSIRCHCCFPASVELFLRIKVSLRISFPFLFVHTCPLRSILLGVAAGRRCR